MLSIINVRYIKIALETVPGSTSGAAGGLVYVVKGTRRGKEPRSLGELRHLQYKPLEALKFLEEGSAAPAIVKHASLVLKTHGARDGTGVISDEIHSPFTPAGTGYLNGEEKSSESPSF